MSSLLQNLGIENCNSENKLQLLHELWDDLYAAEPGTPLTPKQEQELQRRIALDDLDPEGGMTWEEVRELIEKRMKR